MEISFKTITLFTSIILTGLSAGLFFAWSVSVIPGTRSVQDISYLETMQSINRAILNPVFFLIFFGSFALISLSSISVFNTNRLAFGLLLAAAIIYLIGTIGITGFGNVPLNNQLDLLTISEGKPEALAQFRKYYEDNWNSLHLIRTVAAIVSFLLMVITLFLENKI